jgi:hypothetical protein
MKRVILVLVVAALLASGCAAKSATTPSASPTVTPSGSSAATPDPVVGMWRAAKDPNGAAWPIVIRKTPGGYAGIITGAWIAAASPKALTAPDAHLQTTLVRTGNILTGQVALKTGEVGVKLVYLPTTGQMTFANEFDAGMYTRAVKMTNVSKDYAIPSASPFPF